MHFPKPHRALGVALVLAPSVSAPTLPVSLLPVGEGKGVRVRDRPVNTAGRRAGHGEKGGPLILKVQECGLEPRGPVLGT